MLRRFDIAVFVIALLLWCGVTVAQTSVTDEVETELVAGRMALEDGFAERAEAAFRTCLRIPGVTESTAVAARQGLLQALLEQEKYTALTENLEQWEVTGVITEETGAYWRAMVHYRQAQYAESVATLEAASNVFADSRMGAVALRLLGGARLKSGDIAGAINAFSDYASQHPGGDDQSCNRLDWGKALLFQEKLQQAIAVLQPVMLDEEAGHLAAEARYWIGKAHIQAGRVEQGQAMLAPLVGREDLAEDLRVNVVMAVAQGLVQTAGSDKAVGLLEAELGVVRRETSKQELTQRLSRLLLDAGRLEEAVPYVKAYVLAYPAVSTAAGLQLRLADALLEASQYKAAVQAYQHYLEAFAGGGGEADALRGKGWALLGTERYAEAATAFEKAFERFGDENARMGCLFKMGDARFANRQFKQALALYERFLEAFPQSEWAPHARFQMGACWEALNDYAAAENVFEDVVSRHAGTPAAEEALLCMAELRQSREDWEGAKAIYNRLMEQFPEGAFLVQALYGRGMVRYREWSPRALDDFEQVVERFPESDVAEHAFFMRAMCLYRLGRDAQALTLCKAFLRQYAESAWAPSVQFWIGRFLYNTGAYEKAQTVFMAFVERYPEDSLAARALYRAGRAAAKRHEYVRAIELFGQFAKTYPENEWLAEARFHQADAMCELGKFAGAILVFDEVVNNYPESALAPLAWGRKGDCQFTLGADDPARYEEAIRSYRVVTQSPEVRRDHLWQAECKIGRCLEKLGRPDPALEQYYAKVMVPFLTVKRQGEALSESARIWFTRAALAAADIVEAKKDWRQLVRILDRLAEADVASSADARSRITKIKQAHWWLFY